MNLLVAKKTAKTWVENIIQVHARFGVGKGPWPYTWKDALSREGVHDESAARLVNLAATDLWNRKAEVPS